MDEGINVMKKQTTLKDQNPAEATIDERYEGLKQMLLARQRKLLNELHGKIRDVRDEGSQHDPAAASTLAIHPMSRDSRTISNSCSSK